MQGDRTENARSCGANVECRSWRLPGLCALVGLLAAVTGCSSTNFYSLEELTEETIEAVSFPAHSARMSVVRSRFIAYALARYGTHSVETYSREHTKNDATVIYGRLRAHIEAVNRSIRGHEKSEALPTLNRVETVDSALRLIGGAIEPTKRYYRERILSALTLTGPARVIAFAETAVKALAGVAKVEVYRQAMLNDGNYYYHLVIANGAQEDATPPPSYSELLKELVADVCAKENVAPSPSLREDVANFGNPRKWTYFVSPMVREIVCEEKTPSTRLASRQIKAILEIGRKKPPFSKFKGYQENEILEQAEDLVTVRLEDVCVELAAMAGLTPNRPCLEEPPNLRDRPAQRGAANDSSSTSSRAAGG